MIKQGLLDKYGKPNEKTPKDYLQTLSQAHVKSEAKEPDFVIPSGGPDEPAAKRKVSCLATPS